MISLVRVKKYMIWNTLHNIFSVKQLSCLSGCQLRWTFCLPIHVCSCIRLIPYWKLHSNGWNKEICHSGKAKCKLIPDKPLSLSNLVKIVLEDWWFFAFLFITFCHPPLFRFALFAMLQTTVPSNSLINSLLGHSASWTMRLLFSDSVVSCLKVI